MLIRWAIQRGTSVLPKSANAERIAANFDVLDWQLSDEDMHTLSNLDYNVSTHTSSVHYLRPRITKVG